MTAGTVNISRDLFDHCAFRDAPFSEREAWLWIIMEAAWKPRHRRVGHIVISIDRGQLAVSVRFMAEAWGWTAARVQRYVERLKKLKMICVKTDTGLTVITVCNYDKFQTKAKAADTGPIQDRYRTDTNEKKDARREEGKEVSPVGDSPPPIDEIAACVSAYNATAERAGWPRVQTMNPKRRSALSARLRDCGGATGWEVALAKAEASDFLCGRTAKPFVASFDFRTAASQFTTLMEGN